MPSEMDLQDKRNMFKWRYDRRSGNSVFSLTFPASMQIYWNKRKRSHKKRVQLPQDWFGTQTWQPFYFLGTQIWLPWRHVKTHNCNLSNCKLTRKYFGTLTGFEPMASALTLQCSTNWAMKTHTLGAGQFVEFILTRERNELNQFACSQCMGLHSSVGGALKC